MSASPITPEDLNAVTDGATACDKLAELANTRNKMQTFLAWLLANDDTGVLGDGFKEAIIQQLMKDDGLADPNTNGWFVRTNSSTGYLEMVQRISLTDLPQPETDDLDTGERQIIWDGSTWVFRVKDSFVGAPTSGGTVVPASNGGGILLAPHGLTSKPNKFGAILECTTADIGFSTNETIDAKCIHGRNSTPEEYPCIVTGADATNVWVVFGDLGGSSFYRTHRKDNAARDSITPASWNVKLWAEL